LSEREKIMRIPHLTRCYHDAKPTPRSRWLEGDTIERKWEAGKEYPATDGEKKKENYQDGRAGPRVDLVTESPTGYVY